MKWLLFVRHLESTKNLEDRFARRDDDDSLTPNGSGQAEAMAENLWQFSRRLTSRDVLVVCSDSPRAVESAATMISLDRAEMIVDEELRSIIVPEVEGTSSAELLSADPLAAREYNLYRAGLFSSYKLRHTGKYSKAYETKIRNALHFYLSLDSDLAVVFAHRSTFTTALIGFARDVGYYPDDFFGFLPIDFGSCALVEFSDGVAQQILFANLHHTLLNSTGQDFLSTRYPPIQ